MDTTVSVQNILKLNNLEVMDHGALRAIRADFAVLVLISLKNSYGFFIFLIPTLIKKTTFKGNKI
jgi:hypothetical protein